jgi:hypothetical protein
MLTKFKELQGQKLKSNDYDFVDNDLVLLGIESRQKLEPLWKGPFEIKAICGPKGIREGIRQKEKAGNTYQQIKAISLFNVPRLNGSIEVESEISCKCCEGF